MISINNKTNQNIVDRISWQILDIYSLYLCKPTNKSLSFIIYSLKVSFEKGDLIMLQLLINLSLIFAITIQGNNLI